MRQAQGAVWVSEASGGGVRVMRREVRLELCMAPVVGAMVYSGGIDGRYRAVMSEPPVHRCQGLRIFSPSAKT